MLKRGLAFALALVMLASVSVAGATGMEIEKNGQPRAGDEQQENCHV